MKSCAFRFPNCQIGKFASVCLSQVDKRANRAQVTVRCPKALKAMKALKGELTTIWSLSPKVDVILIARGRSREIPIQLLHALEIWPGKKTSQRRVPYIFTQQTNCAFVIAILY